MVSNYFQMARLLLFWQVVKKSLDPCSSFIGSTTVQITDLPVSELDPPGTRPLRTFDLNLFPCPTWLTYLVKSGVTVHCLAMQDWNKHFQKNHFLNKLQRLESTRFSLDDLVCNIIESLSFCSSPFDRTSIHFSADQCGTMFHFCFTSSDQYLESSDRTSIHFSTIL